MFSDLTFSSVGYATALRGRKGSQFLRSKIRNSVRRPSTLTEDLRVLPMFLHENQYKIYFLPHNMLFNISLINNLPKGVKYPGRKSDHLHPSSAEVKT